MNDGLMVTNAAPKAAAQGNAASIQSQNQLRDQLSSAYDAANPALVEKMKALDALDQIAQQTGNQQIAALVAILRKP